MFSFFSLKSFLRSFAWLLPFLFFFFGYQSLNLFLRQATIKTPALVGTSLFTALQKLSDLNLNARILSCTQDTSVAEGTILSQTPSASSCVRHQQTVFLVVSSHPESKKQKSNPEKSIAFYCETVKQDATCIVLIPSFEGKTALEVKKALEKENLAYSFFPSLEHNDNLEQKIVVDQKPLAGSFIDKRTPPLIQLKLNN